MLRTSTALDAVRTEAILSSAKHRCCWGGRWPPKTQATWDSYPDISKNSSLKASLFSARAALDRRPEALGTPAAAPGMQGSWASRGPLPALNSRIRIRGATAGLPRQNPWDLSKATGLTPAVHSQANQQPLPQPVERVQDQAASRCTRPALWEGTCK